MKQHRIFRRTMLIACLMTCATMSAADSIAVDQPRPALSYELRYSPGKTLAMDDYVKQLVKKQTTHSIHLEVHYRPVDPTTAMDESNSFDSHYNFPSLVAGLRYNFNHGTTMHRDADKDWGNLQTVDYTTHLGDAVSLYGGFIRPFFRNKHWECSYHVATGVGYAWNKYNRTDAIDNEMVGAHVSIYFAGGISANYRMGKQWSLRGGLEFAHHSNGALQRPNKGANYFGPFLGLIYTPQQDTERQPVGHDNQQHAVQEPFHPYWFVETTLGFGGKSLLEEWDHTQLELPPTDPDYRTEHFRIYPAYSLQLAIMNRYQLCYASGLALDLFYGTYSNDVKRLDEAAGRSAKYSPFSAALAFKQDFYYKQWTLHGSIGYYLYRHMGPSAEEIEKPYYERIGLTYSFKQWHNIAVGFNVKAHLGKADFTELQIVVPFKL